jgi:hypothetical protein
LPSSFTTDNNSVFTQLCVRLEWPSTPFDLLLDLNHTVLEVNSEAVDIKLAELEESMICTIPEQPLLQDGKNDIFFCSKLDDESSINLAVTVYSGPHGTSF